MHKAYVVEEILTKSLAVLDPEVSKIYNMLREKDEMSQLQIAESIYGNKENPNRLKVARRVKKMEEAGLVQSYFKGASPLGGKIKYVRLNVLLIQNDSVGTAFDEIVNEGKEERIERLRRAGFTLTTKKIKGIQYLYAQKTFSRYLGPLDEETKELLKKLKKSV